MPVDVAGVGISGLGADRDGRSNVATLGRRPVLSEIMAGVLQVTVSPAY